MKLTSILQPLDFFDEANKFVFQGCFGESLDYLIKEKRNYLSLIQNETLAFHFIMRYVDSIGLKLLGKPKFSDSLQIRIESRYN